MDNPYVAGRALYAEYRATSKYIFLPSEIYGRWIRTHPSAGFVTCPDCNAQPGEACAITGRDEDSWRTLSTQVHRSRKDEYRRLRKED